MSWEANSWQRAHGRGVRQRSPYWLGRYCTATVLMFHATPKKFFDFSFFACECYVYLKQYLTKTGFHKTGKYKRRICDFRFFLVSHKTMQEYYLPYTILKEHFCVNIKRLMRPPSLSGCCDGSSSLSAGCSGLHWCLEHSDRKSCFMQGSNIGNKDH